MSQMHEQRETDVRLLARLRDAQDVASWEEFTSIYRPLLLRIARRFGLQEADAENLAQQVLMKVAGQLEQWDTTKPSVGFRRWLATVARNTAIDAIRRVRPDAARGGTSIQLALHEVPKQQDDSEVLFRRELERQVFRWAAARIRPEFAGGTWAAFWETMVEGRDCAIVAEELGKSVGAVYTARSRVMQRLKEEVKAFDCQAAEIELDEKSGGAS